MAHNLTEADSFPTNVSVPDGGDDRNAASVEAPFQALTNRSRHSYNRLQALQSYVRYTISGTGIAVNGKLTLAALASPIISGGFVLASDEVTVPAAGAYFVAALMELTATSASNPYQMQVAIGNILNTPNSQVRASAYRYSATNTNPIVVTGSGIITIADPATEKIYLRNETTTAITVAGSAQERTLAIWRIV